MRTFKRDNQKRGDTPELVWRRARGYFLMPTHDLQGNTTGHRLQCLKPKAVKGKAAVKAAKRARNHRRRIEVVRTAA